MSSSTKHRYQELVAQLPQRNVITELINILTSELHWLAITIEQQFLNTALSDWYLATDVITSGRLSDLQDDVLHFPALLFQLLAVALQLSPQGWKRPDMLLVDGPDGQENLSIRYSRLGVGVMDSIGRNRPTITSIQHDFLLGLWLKNCSQGTEAWRALNSAIRWAGWQIVLLVQC